ncbi:hypothetical protein BDW42DRAFT_53270 [Aspergillus taichungensis]|uniref:Transmembrane protein n=1 Tax=Aspergillus taichungensis TaxID=482145 RepID=A0A2J5I2M7_9EURO|nr:hypothetical protein BDW42DRAFT_53270 [Aspergillus taichungensis]
MSVCTLSSSHPRPAVRTGISPVFCALFPLFPFSFMIGLVSLVWEIGWMADDTMGARIPLGLVFFLFLFLPWIGVWFFFLSLMLIL